MLNQRWLGKAATTISNQRDGQRQDLIFQVLHSVNVALIKTFLKAELKRLPITEPLLHQHERPLCT